MIRIKSAETAAADAVKQLVKALEGDPIPVDLELVDLAKRFQKAQKKTDKEMEHLRRVFNDEGLTEFLESHMNDPRQITSGEELDALVDGTGLHDHPKPAVNLDRFPHTCSECGEPAYNSALSVDCSSSGCRHFSG